MTFLRFSLATELSVNQLSDLTAFASANQGMIAFVESNSSFYSFAANQTATTSNDIVQGVGGQWNRLPSQNPKWALESDWYIDPTNGDDENDGYTINTPLATFGELRHRINNLTLKQTTTVWLLEDVDEYLELSVNIDPNIPTARFIIAGHPDAWTTVYSGSVTASTAPVKTTQPSEGMLVTDSAIDDWDNYVGFRVRMTSGANVGGCFWVQKAISTIQMRGPEGCIAFDASTTVFGPGATIFTPQVSDAFVIERLPGIHGLVLHVDRGSQSGFGQRISSVVTDLEIGKNLAAPEHGTLEMYANLGTAASSGWVAQCRIMVRETITPNMSTYNSMFDQHFASQPKARFFGDALQGGGCLGAMLCNSSAELGVTAGFTVQDGFASSQHGFRVVSPWSVQLGGMAVFDTIGDAIHIGQATNPRCLIISPLYGYGATRTGVQIDAGTVMQLGDDDDMPVITGDLADVEIATTFFSWALLSAGGGYVDKDRMAGVVTQSSSIHLEESVSLTDYGAYPGAPAATNVSAFNAAVIDANGRELILPPGTFHLNAKWLIEEIRGLNIRGSGIGVTKLVWQGTDGDPMIHLYGSRECKLSDFSMEVDAGSYCDTFIKQETKSGFTMTANIITRVQGVSDIVTPRFRWGMAWIEGTGGNANNDLGIMTKVHFNGAEEGCFNIDHSQATGHTFIECSGGNSQRLLRTRAAYSWLGGTSGAGNTVADFEIPSPPPQTQQIYIKGFRSEGSGCLLDVDAGSTTCAVHLEDISFQSTSLRGDNCIIKWIGRSFLTVENSKLGSLGVSGRIHLASTGNRNAIQSNFKNVRILSDLAEPFTVNPPSRWERLWIESAVDANDFRGDGNAMGPHSVEWAEGERARVSQTSTKHIPGGVSDGDFTIDTTFKTVYQLKVPVNMAGRASFSITANKSTGEILSTTLTAHFKNVDGVLTVQDQQETTYDPQSLGYSTQLVAAGTLFDVQVQGEDLIDVNWACVPTSTIMSAIAIPDTPVETFDTEDLALWTSPYTDLTEDSAIIDPNLHTAAWIKLDATITSGISDPDGGSDGYELTEGSGAATSHRIVEAPTNDAQGPFRFTFTAKDVTRGFVIVGWSGNLVGFNLQTGAVVNSTGNASGTIEENAAEDGWYDCTVSIPSQVAGSNINIFLSEDGIATSHDGDGYSSIYLYNVQMIQRRISNVVDQGPDAHDASQTLNADQALYGDSALGEFPRMIFGGTSDHYDLAGSWEAHTGHSIYLIINPTDLTGTRRIISGTNFAVGITNSNVAFFDGTWHEFGAATTGPQIIQIDLPAGGGTAQAYRVTGSSVVDLGTATYATPRALDSVILGSDGTTDWYEGDLGDIVIASYASGIAPSIDSNSVRRFLKWAAVVKYGWTI